MLIKKAKINVDSLRIVRIIGFALYISTNNPVKSVVVAEVILQSVGASPLLWELSLVLLRWYVFICCFNARLPTALFV